MKRTSLVLGVLILTAGTWAVRAGERDQKQLQGTWKITAAGTSVTSVPVLFRDATFTFTGNRVVVHNLDKSREEGTYKLGTSGKVATIDLMLTKEGGKEKRTLEGIYDLNGDTLRLGFAKDSAKGGRPTNFINPTTVTFTLKRQKS